MNPLIEAQLLRDEAEVLHAYKDSKGYLTIGVGHLIDERLGGGISRKISRLILADDIAEKDAECRKAYAWYGALDDVRQSVVLNMRFNLGPRLDSFHDTLAAIARHDYEAAAAHMITSLWARQVGDRANRLAEMMRTGDIEKGK